MCVLNEDSCSSTIQPQQNMKKKIISFIVFPLFVCAAAYAQGITWIPANPMNKARAYFVAVELLNGNVLVAGGFDGSMTNFDFPDAEIYNWHTGQWTRIAPMNTARSAPAAVRLEDGRVMVIGGADENFNFLASAEIYDPRTDMWSTNTASMKQKRFEDFTAVLLPGRKVLVAGGFDTGFVPLNSAEIYDQKTNTWTPTGSMNVARGEFATVVLNDGRVLAVGGVSSVGPLASAEIYDPRTGIWTLTGSMSMPGRNDLALVVLRNGRVLAAGGATGGETSPRLTSAEIFDPDTGQWTPTGPMTAARSEVEYASVLLPDGRVLVPGGYTAAHTPVSSSDLYDPRTGTWTASGSMSVVRAGHSSIVLRGNRGVLVMGGTATGGTATANVDIAVP
jgi:Kelch motif/Galactose oxidase, central domain